MTQQRCCSIFLAFFSLLLSACSGDGTRHPAAQMGDLGGTAGAGSPAPSVGGAGTPTTTADADSGEAAAGGTAETVGDTCSATPDCDDGQPCNGVETCVDEACQAGEAASCGIGMQCSNDDAGACVFTDQSPWIIYEADDDTPGVPEVYAVKRGLLGQMEPIKINAPFAEGWEASRPGEWSPDHQWYSFTIIRREPYDEAAQVVYFGRGLPMPAVELKGAQVVQWSPSGRFFATTEAHGLAIYQYKGTRQRGACSSRGRARASAVLWGLGTQRHVCLCRSRHRHRALGYFRPLLGPRHVAVSAPFFRPWLGVVRRKPEQDGNYL